jgi:hypothetical protein
MAKILTLELQARGIDTASVPGDTVAVTSGGNLVFAANPSRMFATITNDSGNTVYIQLGASPVIGRGIRLNANGGSLTIGLATSIPYLGVVYAIAGSSSNISITEG